MCSSARAMPHASTRITLGESASHSSTLGAIGKPAGLVRNSSMQPQRGRLGAEGQDDIRRAMGPQLLMPSSAWMS
jgi:hypothetical protein